MNKRACQNHLVKYVTKSIHTELKLTSSTYHHVLFQKKFRADKRAKYENFCNGITNENIAKLKNGYRPLSKTCSLNFSCNVFFFCSNILQNFCCKKCLLMFIESFRQVLKLKYTHILKRAISTSV